MNNPYYDKYAKYYDLVYSDKDYEGECDFVEHIFKTYSNIPIAEILDVCCGTGGHAISLAKRDYDITGIDLSEPMISQVKQKAKDMGLRLALHTMDMRNLNLEKRFDACLGMFAVMGYQTRNEDIRSALMSIREHLKQDSLFIFDFWNGLAVLRILPSVRVKIVQDGEKRIIRTAEPEMDTFNHLCYVHYHLLVTQGNAILNEFKETHTVRYFFPQEITRYLQDSGFNVLKVCPFLDLDGRVDENVWNIAAIAKAV